MKEREKKYILDHILPFSVIIVIIGAVMFDKASLRMLGYTLTALGGIGFLWGLRYSWKQRAEFLARTTRCPTCRGVGWIPKE